MIMIFSEMLHIRIRVCGLMVFDLFWQMLDVVMDGCVQRMGALERRTAREESVEARGSGTQAQAQLRAQLDAATAATASMRGNVLQTSRVVEDNDDTLEDTLNTLQAQVKSLLHLRKESASLLVERDALQVCPL